MGAGPDLYESRRCEILIEGQCFSQPSVPHYTKARGVYVGVNLAMRDYVERFRRIEALARSRRDAKGWDYEGWRAARAEEKAVGS